MNKILALLLLLTISGCSNLADKSSYNEQQLDSLLSLQQAADAAYRAQDWPLAIQQYQALLEQYPGHSNSWYRMGNSYSELGKLEQAMAAYEQSIHHDLKNTRAWHNLGILQLRTATRTFLDMQNHASESDEHARRGQTIVDSIGQILQQTYTGKDEQNKSTE